MTADDRLPIVHIGQCFWEPVGPVVVAVSEEGVVSLAMGHINLAKFTESVQARGVGLVEAGRDYSAEAVRQLNAYFARELRDFDLPLDLRGLTEFQRDVYRAACKVRAGSTTAYGDIARAIDNPRASQAVGQALAHNPIPIIIPCHRVVNKTGGLQGYSAGEGIETKRRLLQLEGAMLI